MDQDPFDRWQPHAARLAEDPGDAGALTALRMAFAALKTQAGDEPVRELARCVENLLAGLLDGTVAPTAAAARLVADAISRLNEDADEERWRDLMDRIDMLASGMAEGAFEHGEPESSACSSHDLREPPLLTVREDGEHVAPGMFADSPPDGYGTSVSMDPMPLAAILEALAEALVQLRRQIGLLDIAGGVEFQRLADQLSGTADEIDRLKDTLASWARESTTLLDEVEG